MGLRFRQVVYSVRVRVAAQGAGAAEAGGLSFVLPETGDASHPTLLGKTPGGLLPEPLASPGEALQRSALPGATSRLGPPGPVGPRQIARLAADPGGGAPLSVQMRARLEPVVGRPLGDVRVHRGLRAAEAARALSARAFTVGHDIFVGAHQPGPETAGGLALLAHEATHVAQQAPISFASVPGSPGAHETAASAAARWLTTVRRPAAGLSVDEFEFAVANHVSPELAAQAPGVFALARQQARRAVDRLVAGDPSLRRALAAARVDEPEVVAPVRLVADGKTDAELARELGEAVARQVVNRARRLAGQPPDYGPPTPARGVARVAEEDQGA